RSLRQADPRAVGAQPRAGENQMTGNVTMAQRQLVRLQEAVSIDARVFAVNQAVWARNDRVVDQDERWYPVEVFDEYVIVRRGTGLLRVPYTMDDAGIVTEF